MLIWLKSLCAARNVTLTDPVFCEDSFSCCNVGNHDGPSHQDSCSHHQLTACRSWHLCHLQLSSDPVPYDALQQTFARTCCQEAACRKALSCTVGVDIDLHDGSLGVYSSTPWGPHFALGLRMWHVFALCTSGFSCQKPIETDLVPSNCDSSSW